MTTPMMAQWHACKEKAPDALLLFRLGDFYEAFHDDAKLISKEAGVTLTARQGVPMCGVPFHTAETYLDKLLSKGYKIAIAEQIEDAKESKGLVRREIVRIVSPGTLVGSDLLIEKRNNFIISIAQAGLTFGLAALDITTGDFFTLETTEASELIDEIYRIQPTEIVVSRKWKNTHGALLSELALNLKFALTEKEDWRFDPQSAGAVLMSHFNVQTLDGFGLKAMMGAVGAAGSLMGYLQQEMSLKLEHVTAISVQPLKNTMAIDRSTLKNLELLESTQMSGRRQSLVDLLDHTQTPMGARLLRNWIKSPLLSVTDIVQRQDAVSESHSRDLASYEARQYLDGVRDLERLMMKISARFATPRDLLALGLSLAKLTPLKESLGAFDSALIRLHREKLTDPVSSKILKALSPSPPMRMGEGEIFRDGFHAGLDELRKLSKDSLSWMNDYQVRLREETGIRTLKVGFTKAFGYYIEATHAQSGKIPDNFQRRQTLVNGERFVTEELKKFEHQVLTAEERSKALEAQLFEELRSYVAGFGAQIFAAAKAVGVLDLLFTLGYAAKEYRFTRPIVDESNVLEIVEGRHPIVEQVVGKSAFIANDTHLSDEQRLMLITGPNMAGKSTYIRQVALIAVLAQIGSFVPAQSARIGIIDKIFSRIGASDDLARGQSTFMVEMAETANILNNATSRSLVLLDEIGRGTSTYDGISIAWSVAEYLLTTQGKQAKTLFATHYWELTRLEQEVKGAVNFQVAVQETAQGIVFLRKIVKGGTDKSYGIHVAKLAGLPFKAIRRAEEMLMQLEAGGATAKKRIKKDEQLCLLSVPQTNPLVEQLRMADLNRLTPFEALVLLHELKKHA